ncbi:phasin family protein [Microvirga sp. G4-2]|uniref:phasin family protein n=1 Tax=Microvirga sp. G4-2 TaxID=3434467 RepID=UPI0040444F1C
MATMPKSSGTSDTLRGGAGYALSGDSGRALVNATETWFAAATEWQREMMSFVSMRLEKDAETAREMMGCRNVADVTAIQSRWMEETLRDYNSEMGKLMTICTKSVDGGGRTRG